jgi:hypothetical protein
MEGGRWNPSLSSLHALAEAFDVLIEDLADPPEE